MKNVKSLFFYFDQFSLNLKDNSHRTGSREKKGAQGQIRKEQSEGEGEFKIYLKSC